jgi:hypothetical protein
MSGEYYQGEYGKIVEFTPPPVPDTPEPLAGQRVAEVDRTFREQRQRQLSFDARQTFEHDWKNAIKTNAAARAIELETTIQRRVPNTADIWRQRLKLSEHDEVSVVDAALLVAILKQQAIPVTESTEVSDEEFEPASVVMRLTTDGRSFREFSMQQYLELYHPDQVELPPVGDPVNLVLAQDLQQFMQNYAKPEFQHLSESMLVYQVEQKNTAPIPAAEGYEPLDDLS